MSQDCSFDCCFMDAQIQGGLEKKPLKILLAAAFTIAVGSFPAWLTAATESNVKAATTFEEDCKESSLQKKVELVRLEARRLRSASLVDYLVSSCRSLTRSKLISLRPGGRCAN
jgi:hypothetical protein